MPVSDFIALIGHFFWIFPGPGGLSLAGWVCQTKYGRGDSAMPIANTSSDIWGRFQGELFPALTELPGPLSERHQRFAAVLEFATPEAFLPAETRQAGRPREDRAALARSFLAKAILEPAAHAASG